MSESAIVKATVIEAGVQMSQAATSTDRDKEVFEANGAISPPYDPAMLCRYFERSTALLPCRDSYATNIDGFGCRLEPVVNLEDQDKLRELVRDALTLDRITDDDPYPVVPDSEVAARLLALPTQVRVEKLWGERFLEWCSDVSLDELRKRRRNDLEMTGNDYQEVLCGPNRRPARFLHLPSASVRLLPEGDPIEVSEPWRSSLLTIGKRVERRRFRKYIQVLCGQVVAFFKEWGDPRLMSARTGRYFESEALMVEAEGGAAVATEILHRRIYTPLSAYGVPRWIGASLAVTGSRAADEVNVMYFDNKAIPPLAVLVSGAELAPGAVDRIKKYIETDMRGRDNFHSILVLEAAPASGVGSAGAAARVRIELVPLAGAQQQDALFLNYDDRNAQKIRAQFRLPPILAGDTRDFNRATAESALLCAEQQVFAGERAADDATWNRLILPRVGIRYHRLVSNSPIATDSAGIASALHQLGDYVTVREGHEIARDVFKNLRDLPKDAPWLDVPPLILRALKGAPDASAAPLEGAGGAPERKVIPVPEQEFASWLKKP